MKYELLIGIIVIIIGGLLGNIFGWHKSTLGFSGILMMILGGGIALKIHKKLKIDVGILTGIIFAVLGLLIYDSGEYRGHSVPKMTAYLFVLVGTVIAVTSYCRNKP